MSAKQMHGLAHLASNYGTGELRLTVWQNVIIPHIADAFTETVRRAAIRLGFFTETSTAAGGIVACTGSKGCKYAASDTKGHAITLFTGCPHSCAQHYCGDIGFIGAKLQDGAEGYHMVVGGGMDHEQGIAPEVLRGVRASEVNDTVDKLLAAYLASREHNETFVTWSRRLTVGQLQEKLSA
jgi:ferredoxin-nitrite reductase